MCGCRPTAMLAKCFPMGRSGHPQPLGGAEYNAGFAVCSHTPGTAACMPVAGTGGRVQETGGAAGWPELPRAVGLSQRSLLGLLDSRRTPLVRPAPSRNPAKLTPEEVSAGGVG